MPSAPIRFFNRYTQTVETEKVAGERWMRWLYEMDTGRLALHLLVRRAWLSRYYGWRMSLRASGIKVLPFIVEHGIDVDEFVKPALNYKTFNEFFIRALKPEARPIAAGDEVAVFPSDGRHLAFPDIDAAAGFYVKGEKFRLSRLVAEDEFPESRRDLTNRYRGGAMLISRLCPVDYHRFHFPVAATPSESVLTNGWLYSVSPIALRRNIRYLVENKRMLTHLESPRFGRVLMIEVGATMVGSIVQAFVPGRPVAKGEEKGFFKIGGSCVITLFEPGRIRFDEDLIAHSRECQETYAHMGDRLGVAGS
jgi:phosphatidylserine decarboxylase